MLQPMHIVDQRATSYATVADFLNTLTEELHRLNLLSLLLTADKNKAEQCLVCAMGECVEGERCFHGVGAFVGSAGGSQVCNPDDQAAAGAPG